MKIGIGNIKPEHVFVIIALIYGLSFLVVVPPFQVPDESNHFLKAVGLSEGYLVPEKLGNEAGVYVSGDVWDLTQNSFYGKIETGYVISKLSLRSDEFYKHFADFSGIAVVMYSPIPYFTAAFAIDIGKLLGMTPLLLMYLARLANLLLWIFIVYLAIRIIPVHKWVLLMLALMPMTLYEAASVSADSLTIALSFLVISIILKMVFSYQSFRKKDFLILITLGSLLALSKQIYSLIVFLFLLIPKNKFGNYKKKYGTFVLICIPVFLVAGCWALISKGLYMPTLYDVSFGGQMSFILSQPLSYVSVFVNTLHVQGIEYLSSFVGLLSHPGEELPVWLVSFYLIMLVVCSILDKNSVEFHLKQRLTCFIMVLLFIFIMMTLMYVTWTSVGYNQIMGIQGRYFIPIAPVIFLLFYNSKKKIRISNLEIKLKLNSYYKGIIIGSIIFTLSMALLWILKVHYGILYGFG